MLPAAGLDSVNLLVDEGRYADALAKLDGIAPSAANRLQSDIVRAELFERLGRLGQSKILVEAIKRTRRASPSEQSLCELIHGRMDWEEGATASAVSRIQKAVSLASDCGDLRRRCWAQLWLVLLVADRSGPSAAAPILSECRQDAIRVGEPRIWAAIHAFSGLMDARRGLLRSALAHIRLSEELLTRAPNAWLEACVEFTRTNVAVLRSDYGLALTYSDRAIALAERSGSAACLRTSSCNQGFIHYSLGQFEEAIRDFRHALGVLPSNGEHHRSMLDTLARIRLAQGSLDECAALLTEIEGGIASSDDKLLYGHRYATLTRSLLFVRQGLPERALKQVDYTLRLAEQAKDHFLTSTALLEKAQILQQLHRIPESMEILRTVVATIPVESPELYAQYEVVLGCALLSQGQDESAQVHRERAERIFGGLRYQPGLLGLANSWQLAKASTGGPARSALSVQAHSSGAQTIQAAAALFAHSSRPELIASALVELLRASECVLGAIATLGTGDELSVLASTGVVDSRPVEELMRVYAASVQETPVEVLANTKSDVQSIATVNAIALLLSTIQELERARVEREERLTLWPIEDVPVINDHAVVNGKMRELMSTSRRVATTDISVLLTGESGTGKEILARAIHTFSDRADQPFVPFNCAALPRDMLESQLFGHRRGAFTGADRDNPGVIRAARGGTLFLDEIGELNIDLQPKLLRFLESGEICPLGETTPFTVKVRIVAATNARLDEAVKAGRFREDLFYRLNVVRLQIPPLRDRRDELPSLVHHFVTKAAVEYRKGQIRIAENTMERLLLAPWPGNIRQLQNELRRMIALADVDAILTPAALSSDVAGATEEAAAGRDHTFTPPPDGKLNPAVARLERDMIRAALQQHRGRMDAAAKALGISRKGLYLKRQRLGL